MSVTGATPTGPAQRFIPVHIPCLSIQDQAGDVGYLTDHTSDSHIGLHSYRAGRGCPSVILLPIASTAAETRLMTLFCRRISRTAPLLVPKSALLQGGGGFSGGLAVVVAEAVRKLGLGMIPVVVVGQARAPTSVAVC